MTLFRSISLLALAILFCTLGCSQTESDEGPLVWQTQYQGNVSTMIRYDPHGRVSRSDGYAPDFVWLRSDGSLDSLSAHQGKPVILNFWATWCAPCKMEMPDLQAIADQVGDSALVLGIATDNTGHAFQKVATYVSSNHYSYQVVVDSNLRIFQKYLIDFGAPIPQTFILDAAGHARFNLAGAQSKSTFLSYLAKVK